MRYFLLEPEVAGALGPESDMDSSVHPPRVTQLHYELQGWLGDDLLETFPCYVVTSRCKEALENAAFSGCTFAPAKITTADTFSELYPGRPAPVLHWLKVSGEAGKSDVGLASDYRIVVSEAVLEILMKFQLDNCDIEDFTEVK